MKGCRDLATEKAADVMHQPLFYVILHYTAMNSCTPHLSFISKPCHVIGML